MHLNKFFAVVFFLFPRVLTKIMFLFELIFFCFVYKKSHPINAFIVEIIANGALSQTPLTFLT
jgi:hypothetical protein